LVHAWPKGYRTSAFDDFPIVFEAGPPDRLEASPEPPRLLVGGNRATIRVHVLDCGGNAVDDGTLVTYTLVSGEGSLSPQTSSTGNGWAYSYLTSPDRTGSATVRVAAGDREAMVVVEYIPGPPFDITLTADPLSIPANGVSTSIIGAEVKDSHGNAVADRTTIVFSTELGRFETGASYTTSVMGGRASAVLTSSSTAGIARVAALTAGKRGEIYVDFYFGPTPSAGWKQYLPIIFKH
jgi:adhesin/invasin